MTPFPAVVVLGRRTLGLGRRIQAALPGTLLHGPREDFAGLPDVVPYDQVAARLADLHGEGRPIIALCASGIVIRALAAQLGDKRAEPAVVAVAEDGSVAVPLLGGHQGANRLARAIAEALGGTAAITTAGDLRLGFALDEPPPGWQVRNPAAAKPIATALLDGREVVLAVEAGHADWLTGAGSRWARTAGLDGQGDDGGPRPTVRVTTLDDPGAGERLVVHPRVLALGVGCEQGIAAAELADLVGRCLADHGLAVGAIGAVVSLELKAAEPAIHALARQLGVPARFFEATTLAAETPRLATPSETVRAAVGTPGVAEAAALAAVGPAGRLVVAKTRSARATCAIAESPAPLDPEAIGRPQGELAVVGLGPGQASWRTPEAHDLLARAEALVGYHGYLDLVEPALRAGRACHGRELGEETDRARLALELAAEGRRVALVSSGDPGIYAMAALVHELLERPADPAWQRVAVSVSPGISALQAAAARAGAPLGHDFCAISLSDLLTPWPVIARRLEAAAAGDFVTALYNPASGRRRQGLIGALEILGEARPPDVPVVHARQLGRPEETVTLGRLADLDPATVDMVSILIVGARQSRLVTPARGKPFVYTPRGYHVATSEAP